MRTCGAECVGQEIDTSSFEAADFVRFQDRLRVETALLTEWFNAGAFAHHAGMAGFELEAWLVDKQYQPAPVNTEFLAALQDELVSPELSKFNVEINVEPAELAGDVLSRIHASLEHTWGRCVDVARDLRAGLVMVGILPSVRETELVLSNMSRMRRYQALNEQVIRQRRGRPLELNIVGHQHLRTTHFDVMLESATTSFQIHRQVAPAEAARFYNASLIASAATVAVGANAPFLFGHDLWDDTRIPLFEQAVDVGGFAGAAYGPVRRVSFGTGYVRDSVLECFVENEAHFPVLLPMEFDTDQAQMSHVRLHNGTIWRWNRPLIGLDEDGTPHLRIEHRVVSAGPTVVDCVANAAFYYGLLQYLATESQAPEGLLAFATARDNFYAAARHGLQAGVTWFDEQRGVLSTLLLEQLIPQARAGLEMLNVATADATQYMDIIDARVQSGRTGAAWQRQYAQRTGCDMAELTARYAELQASANPVHDWPLPATTQGDGAC